MVSAFPVQRQQRAFFECRVRKEACVKAAGKGLHINLSDFTVSLLPGQSDRILSMKDGTLGASELYVLDRWRLATLAVPAGYVAAIATDGKYERLRNWRYPAMWVD